ncbi:MAG: ABC transporter substrate-binding protein [Candidatus Bathyarchaeia archaeon]|jgi:ABC-type transport system substrate-binding protein
MGISKKTLTIVLIFALAASMMTPMTFVKAQHNGLFKVTIIAPGNANLLRRQWSQVFASNLQQLGIDANVVYLDWTSVYSRALTPSPDMVGKTYDQGGYDILALGWTPGLIPEPRETYYGGAAAFFAPTGQNYYLWNDSQSNSLLDQFITSTSDSDRASALTQWQQVYYNQVPASQIMYQEAPVVVNPAIGNLYTPVTGGGEGWLYFNAQPYPQLLTRSDGKTSITYCSTGSIDALNPPESDSWYDVIVAAPIFDGLAETWPTLNGLSALEAPALLTTWSHSTDGFTWTFNCRQGVTWQDGAPFTADDVLYSLWALMNPDTGSQFAGYYQSVYGDNVKFTYSDGTSVTLGTGSRTGTIQATDKYTVVAHLPVCADGKPYGYFEPYLLSFANNIIPMHIFSHIAPADWSTSCFNTGQGSTTINGIKYTGPVGTGPYKWVSYDPVAQVVHLQKYDNYWNATGLESMGDFKIKDYYIQFIADKTSALAALKNGQVDMLDYNYQMQTDIPSINPSWGKVIILQGVGRQEFGYNMESPIFGTGVNTPLGQSNSAQAAQAAADIRIAFDYAVPRQLIINNLLAGYGTAGETPMLPTQPYYDNSIKARPFDLNQARHYLELAGYSPPTVNGVGIVNLQGTYNDSSGNPLANETITLEQTTNNSTYPSGLTGVSHFTTDINGFYSFTVNPTAAGKYYYYLMDDTSGTPVYTYLQSVNVAASSTLSSNTIILIAAVVVVVVVIIAAVVLMTRRRHK